jgi:hypothetical protein
MQYILEIVTQRTETSWETEDTIESDTPIPIPGIGDELMTPSGLAAQVISRHYWFTYVNRVPLVKVEIRCRKTKPGSSGGGRQDPTAEKNRKTHGKAI